jgi:putative tryptophan/tyrosine transport system substrate-binding protein
MRRREFITLLGGAVVWPRSGVAQQSSIPIIGFLTARSRNETTDNVAQFREGLREAGYREGETVSIEFRWASGEYDRLPVLAADLAQHRVSVIVTSGGNLSAQAAKAATTTIPIVSLLTDDPVQDGLVASLNQPGGNLTGVNFLTTSLEPIRLEFLHKLVPNAPNIAILVNPKNTLQAEIELRDVPAAARALGLQVIVLRASDESTIDAAFTTIAEQGIEALLVASDTFFFSRRNQIVALAARDAVPAMYQLREYVEAGGLMSYGTSLADAYRQLGMYTCKILNGAKPSDLPIQQSTKVELVINLKTAKALGLNIPLPLLGRADEVIE